MMTALGFAIMEDKHLPPHIKVGITKKQIAIMNEKEGTLVIMPREDVKFYAEPGLTRLEFPKEPLFGFDGLTIFKQKGM